MKDAKIWRIWEVLYPVGIYFVVTNLVMVMIGTVWRLTNENYMTQQIIATAAAFPFLYIIYRRNPAALALREKTVAKASRHGSLPGADGSHPAVAIACGAGLVAAVALAGVTLNNLIGYTGLKEASQSYQEAADAFYGGRLWLEIAGSCILIPIAEELLYRGIVYRRLRAWMRVGLAVPVSALIFGVMHFNLVQFIYAGCIGVLLALVMEYAGLPAAMASHMLTNLISVLRSETEWFDFMHASPGAGAASTAVSAALSACLFLLILTRRRKQLSGQA